MAYKTRRSVNTREEIAGNLEHAAMLFKRNCSTAAAQLARGGCSGELLNAILRDCRFFKKWADQAQARAGFQAYARDRVGDPTWDVDGDLTALQAAVADLRTRLRGIGADLFEYDADDQLIPKTFTGLAPLQTALNAVDALIEDDA